MSKQPVPVPDGLGTEDGGHEAGLAEGAAGGRGQAQRELGHLIQVQRLLKVLEKPFSTQPGLEQPSCLAQGVVEEQGEMEQQGAEALASRMCVPHDSKLPSLGQ